MRTVKTSGMSELTALRKRVKRAFSLGRITKPDFERLCEKMDELEAIIVNMRELNELGEEEG